MLYKNILLPTDGLGKCEYGVCHGIILAKELGAKLTAVHITSQMTTREMMEILQPHHLVARSEGKKAQEALANAEQVKQELGSKALEVSSRMATATGVPCETVQISGTSPVDGILKVAKEKGCDLIFISTHGKRGIMGTLFGTIATKIIAQSKIPVLVHHCGGPK